MTLGYRLHPLRGLTNKTPLKKREFAQTSSKAHAARAHGALEEV